MSYQPPQPHQQQQPYGQQPPPVAYAYPQQQTSYQPPAPQPSSGGYQQAGVYAQTSYQHQPQHVYASTHSQQPASGPFQAISDASPAAAVARLTAILAIVLLIPYTFTVALPYWIVVSTGYGLQLHHGLWTACYDGYGCERITNPPGYFQWIQAMAVIACVLVFVSLVLSVSIKRGNNQNMRRVPASLLIMSSIAATIAFGVWVKNMSDGSEYYGFCFYCFTVMGAINYIFAVVLLVKEHRLASSSSSPYGSLPQ